MSDVENNAKCLFCCHLYKPESGVGFCLIFRKEVNGQDDPCEHYEEDEVVTWSIVNEVI